MILRGVSIQKGTTPPKMSDDTMARFPVVPRTRVYEFHDPKKNPFDKWLQVDASYAPQIKKRLQYLENYRDMVIDRYADTPTTRAAETELRDAVVAHLTETYPQYFEKNDNSVHATPSGVTVNLDEADPLAAVAVLAAEDLLLMGPAEKNDKGTQIYRLDSGILAFPNGWSLRSFYKGDDEEERAISVNAARLGKSPAEIHRDVVPHYDAYFVDKVDQGFARLPAGHFMWRRNWGMQLNTKLFRHADMPDPDMDEFFNADGFYERGIIRSEHETFTKLRQSGAVVFGIKTYVWNLRDMLADDAARAALIEGYDNLTPEMVAYRSESMPILGDILKRYRIS